MESEQPIFIEAWEGMRTLITGIDGFIGGRLASEMIADGAMVFGVVEQIDYRKPMFGAHLEGGWRLAARCEAAYLLDIRDYEAVKRVVAETRPEVIYHLAAITQVKDAEVIPRQTMDINIMGTVNLLEAVRSLRETVATWDPHIILASSDKAYGEPVELPLIEESRLNPLHPYDVSKASMDLIAQSYGHFFGLRTAITRFANVYGAGDTNWQRLIPGTIRALLHGKPPIIRSNGSLVREYLHVDDVVAAYRILGLLGITTGLVDLGSVYNFTSREPITVMDLVELIRAIMGKDMPEPIVADSSTTETQEVRLLDDPIRDLGWEPQVDLSTGLERTISWLADYFGLREWRYRWWKNRTANPDESDRA